VQPVIDCEASVDGGERMADGLTSYNTARRRRRAERHFDFYAARPVLGGVLCASLLRCSAVAARRGKQIGLELGLYGASPAAAETEMRLSRRNW